MNEVMASSEKVGEWQVISGVKVLKLFHAVRYDWRVLGETAWRIELREASRRGFKGWFKGIIVLKREVLGGEWIRLRCQCSEFLIGFVT